MISMRASGALALGAVVCLLAACGDDTGTGGTGTSSGNSSATSGSSKASTSASSATATSSGTGAMACTTDVCATYGAAVPQVASNIVDEAATSPEFMDDFAPLVAQGPAAVMAFKTSLANFISDAYGCTQGAYTGPTMQVAHQGQGITQQEYDAFIGLIAGVLSDAGVPQTDIANCFAPPLVAPAFASTIIGQ